MSGMHTRAHITAETAKSAAKNIKSRLGELGITLSMGHAYEALAGSLGYANWSTMKAKLHSHPAEPSMPEIQVDAVEALRRRMRDAVLKAAKNRKFRLLHLDIRFALRAVLDEAVDDPSLLQALLPSFPGFFKSREAVSRGTFVDRFRGYLGQQVIPEIGDTLASAFADDVWGKVATSLRAAERKAFDFATASGPYHLGSDGITLAEFKESVSRLMDEHSTASRRIADKAKAVSEADIDANAKELQTNLTSIACLIEYDPKRAYDMFISERPAVAGKWDAEPVRVAESVFITDAEDILHDILEIDEANKGVVTGAKAGSIRTMHFKFRATAETIATRLGLSEESVQRVIDETPATLRT